MKAECPPVERICRTVNLPNLRCTDRFASMKTLTPRRPAAVKRSQRTGATGQPAARRKAGRLTAEEMMRELDKLAPQCPPMDTKAFLDEGE